MTLFRRNKGWLMGFMASLLLLGAVALYQSKKETNPSLPSELIPPLETSIDSPSLLAGTENLNQQKHAEALNSGMLASCNEIKNNTELQQSCKDQLYFAQAQKNNLPSKCEQILKPDLKSDCLDKLHFKTALELNETKICQKIEDPATQESCQTQILSLQNQIELNQKQQDAIDSNISQNCQTIGGNLESQNCIETIKNNQAIIEQSKIAEALKP